MSRLYFAYGSNLKLARMAERLPGARPAGVAALADHRLVFDKRGRDGTAKANLADAPGERVWGALYEVRPVDLAALDGFEGGYDRVAVRVATRAAPDGSGAACDAFTYRSTRTDPELPAAAAYLELVLEGAREQGLPADYLGALAAAVEASRS